MSIVNPYQTLLFSCRLLTILSSAPQQPPGLPAINSLKWRKPC
jgi:hypothetical protein